MGFSFAPHTHTHCLSLAEYSCFFCAFVLFDSVLWVFMLLQSIVNVCITPLQLDFTPPTRNYGIFSIFRTLALFLFTFFSFCCDKVKYTFANILTRTTFISFLNGIFIIHFEKLFFFFNSVSVFPPSVFHSHFMPPIAPLSLSKSALYYVFICRFKMTKDTKEKSNCVHSKYYKLLQYVLQTERFIILRMSLSRGRNDETSHEH